MKNIKCGKNLEKGGKPHRGRLGEATRWQKKTFL